MGKNAKQQAERKKPGACVHPAHDLPFTGYNLLVEPASLLTPPCVQCEEHPVFRTLRRRSWTQARLKDGSEFPDQSCSTLCVGTLAALFYSWFVCSHSGLVTYLRRQHSYQLTFLWSAKCQRKWKQISCNIAMCPQTNWSCIVEKPCCLG